MKEHIIGELPEKYDRRRKLSSEDTREIVKLYATGDYSWRTLAEKFGVHKSRIGQILHPERNKEWVKSHWRDYQKHGKEWADTVREHRAYKKKLYEAGKIS